MVVSKSKYSPALADTFLLNDLQRAKTQTSYRDKNIRNGEMPELNIKAMNNQFQK